MESFSALFSILLLLLLLILIRRLSGATKPNLQGAESSFEPLLNEFDETKYHQGLYTPHNPEKYEGDVDNIIYRSGWELTAFQWCDWNSNIIEWSSEELSIGYYMKGVPYERRYYPDLVIRFSGGDVMIVEIKPDDQIRNPNYENRCKWAATRAYCRDNGIQFKLWGYGTIKRLSAKAKYWESKLMEVD